MPRSLNQTLVTALMTMIIMMTAGDLVHAAESTFEHVPLDRLEDGTYIASNSYFTPARFAVSTWAEQKLVQGQIRYGVYAIPFEVFVTLDTSFPAKNRFVGTGEMRVNYGGTVCLFTLGLDLYSYDDGVYIRHYGADSIPDAIIGGRCPEPRTINYGWQTHPYIYTLP